MRIGPLLVDPPVILAPMSGITDRSFRLLCRQAGAGLVCTGLVSANALHYGSHKTAGLLAFDPHEHPVCAQVFGADPDRVAAAAAAAASQGADMVDINMGCAVPKVLKQRAGAALMADPERAEAIVRAVVAAVKVPVSVKLRTGWRDRGEDAPALALRCQTAGAAAVTVHPRFVSQRLRGSADWSVIARVKQAVGLPVIGSGDIHCAADAPRMMEETGCDAVMVGRAALGSPWIFAHIAAALAGAPAPPPPSPQERAGLMVRHLRLVVADRGERRGIPEMRKHFAWYLRGVPGARALREKVNHALTQDDLAAVAERVASGAAAEATVCGRPRATPTAR